MEETIDQHVALGSDFDILAVTSHTVEALLSKSVDALALFMLYYLDAFRSPDKTSRLTVKEIGEKLRISEDRIRKAKKEISSAGLMEEKTALTTDGKLDGKYIILSQSRPSQISLGRENSVIRENANDGNGPIYSTHAHVRTAARNKNLINNTSYNNNYITKEEYILGKESVREKLSLSYPEEKGTQTPADESTRADALIDSTPLDPKKDFKRMNEGIPKFIEYWNGRFKKNFRVTPDFEEAFKAAWRKYGPDDMMLACENYFKYIRQNDWYTHRFAPYEFLKQKNGLPKYLNM